MTAGVTIVGAGKVGEALAKSFFRAGLTIDSVVSGSEESAVRLAGEVGSSGSIGFDKPVKSDFIILAVPDKAIGEVCSSLGPVGKSIVLHTAGSCGMEVFSKLKCRGCGVLYPLQTFSRGREIDISGVPFLVEGERSETEDRLVELAGLISDNVFRVKTEERRLIHLSAVFVCNFINHMLQAGEEITSKTGLPDSILYPLVDETIKKAREIGAAEAQTGPAVRNDITTIEKHIDLLSFSSELKEIYEAVTRSIIKNKPS